MAREKSKRFSNVLQKINAFPSRYSLFQLTNHLFHDTVTSVTGITVHRTQSKDDLIRMNTALAIVFLLLPAFPSFTGAWNSNKPIAPGIAQAPVSTHKYMSDTDLKKQADLLKNISDPIVRSRIVRDIANSCNANLFTVLDKHLAQEKDPAVRADIISALANLPVRTEQPEDLPILEINWKSANTAEYERSRNSSYLPERMAAERFLAAKKTVPMKFPAIPNEITKQQEHFFKMRKTAAPELMQTLLKVIDSGEHILVRVEAIRTLSHQKTLTNAAVQKLQKIVCQDYIRVDRSKRRFDHDSVRAAAYMALVEHAKEPEAAKALKAIDPKLDKLLAKGKNPLLQEYVRQIRLAAKGEQVVPSPLPQKGTDQTFRFIE